MLRARCKKHPAHFTQSLACAQLFEIRLEFDFNIYTTWQVQFHQSVNCFLSWVDDINKAFVGTHLELLTRVFVLVSRTDNRVKTAFSWKRNWSSNCCACASCSFNDFCSGCVKCTVLVRFQADADFFVCHLFLLFVYLR